MGVPLAWLRYIMQPKPPRSFGACTTTRRSKDEYPVSETCLRLPNFFSFRYDIGKQTVYHALQDASDTLIPEAAAALKLEIDNLESQLPTLKADEKRARAALATLAATPRISDLRHDISRLENERSAIQTRLARHHEDDSVPLSPTERQKLEAECKRWQRHVSVRRRICRELWGQCSEVLPEGVTAAELWVS